jgi:2OG-Fe(II) oxygenase superfamily
MIDEDRSMADELLPNIAIPDAVKIGSAAARIDDAPAVLARARAAFACGNALALPSAFDPAFLRTILAICRRGPYVPEYIDKIGWRSVEERDVAGCALRFALQRPAFLRWCEAAAECETLQLITGTVAEMAAGTDQGLGWHDDRNDGGLRKLAVTIHLSDAPYEGGLFEMCEKQSGRLLVREGALPPGSVMLFRIDKRLRHRVTQVICGGPRRVFAGWLSA